MCDRLKELGFAVQNFHDVQGILPSASYQRLFKKYSVVNGNYGRFSGLYVLLPFIEHNDLYVRGINNIEHGAKRKTSLSSIVDGTSNTVFFSECVVGTVQNGRDVKGGQVVMDYSNGRDADWPNLYFTPSLCEAARGADGEISEGYYVVTVADQLMGQRWGDAQAPYTLFWTIMPRTRRRARAALKTASEARLRATIPAA